MRFIQFPRVTPHVLDTLEALLARNGEETHGYEIRQTTSLASGTLHHILNRLHANGWTDRRWEQAGEQLGRPPRRYYRLTNDGAEAARQLLRLRRPESPALADRALEADQ